MNPFQAFRGRVSSSESRHWTVLTPFSIRKPHGHMSPSIHLRGVSSCLLVLSSATDEQERRSSAMLLHCICWSCSLRLSVRWHPTHSFRSSLLPSYLPHSAPYGHAPFILYNSIIRTYCLCSFVLFVSGN